MPLPCILGSPTRVFKVFHSLELLEWGLRRMDAAAGDPASPAHRAAYRDGLIIALFAARGLRIGSMAALQLGTNLISCDNGWRLELAAADMKNERHLGYGLPDRLAPYIDRYVNEVRPAFGVGRRQGPVSVVEGGGPFTLLSIDRMIRRASRELTPEGFGSHTFRRSVGTIAPIASPDRPAAAAALLGVSQGVAERHYNLGQVALAAEQYHAALRKIRGD